MDSIPEKGGKSGVLSPPRSGAMLLSTVIRGATFPESKEENATG